jgi:AcrR family transcriptional regulator
MPEMREKWIEHGYKQFALFGIDCLNVEKLAREIGYNKSGFYHYFVDREMFLYELTDHHVKVNEQFREEISKLEKFDPGYLVLVIKYKTAVMVQMQLRKHSDVLLFQETFNDVWKKNEKVLLPLWASYLKITDNLPLASELWVIFRDIFFMRVTNENFNLHFIKYLLNEFSGNLETLRHYSPTRNQKGS